MGTCLQYFKVPRPYQERVLKWGIIGACVMRGAFIGAGIVAINSFRPILLAFAGFLVFSSYKMLTCEEHCMVLQLVYLRMQVCDIAWSLSF